MKLINTTAALFIACMFSCLTYAQRPNIVKQPPKINGVLKATTSAAVNAKIHANSNTVFGTGNGNATKYNKKDQPKKNEIKTEEEVTANTKAKKQKNKKPGKILAVD